MVKHKAISSTMTDCPGCNDNFHSLLTRAYADMCRQLRRDEAIYFTEAQILAHGVSLVRQAGLNSQTGNMQPCEKTSQSITCVEGSKLTLYEMTRLLWR